MADPSIKTDRQIKHFYICLTVVPGTVGYITITSSPFDGRCEWCSQHDYRQANETTTSIMVVNP